MTSSQRLDHLLARNLGVSRGEVRRLIAAGEVRTEDGRVLSDARTPVAPPCAVRAGTEPVVLHDRFDLLLNKPPGCVTALRDERHPTAYALLRGAPLFPELRPVGRLDLDTAGLLLWTTDGTWLQRLTHPKRRVPRTYQAALARAYTTPVGLVLEDGHRPEIVDLHPLAPADRHPSLPPAEGAAAHASITIVGGAYHEVRRIFAALGSHVLALCRVGFGRITLPPDLPPGGFVCISPDQV